MAKPTKTRASTGNGDFVAKNRTLKLVEAAAVPTPTRGFQPSSTEAKRRLRRLAAELKAEAGAALKEISKKAKNLKEDLGKFAPDGARAAALDARLENAGALVVASDALAVFAGEMDEIAGDDVVIFLESVAKRIGLLEHSDPGSTSRYPALANYVAARAAITARAVASKKRNAATKAASQAPQA